VRQWAEPRSCATGGGTGDDDVNGDIDRIARKLDEAVSGILNVGCRQIEPGGTGGTIYRVITVPEFSIERFSQKRKNIYFPPTRI